MSVEIKDANGNWRKAAGNGKAEYGASTVRSGLINVPQVDAEGTADVEVIFDTPMPDADYQVTIEYPTVGTINLIAWIKSKTANGFILGVGRPMDKESQTNVIKYTAFKLYTDTEYNEVLDDVAENTAAITAIPKVNRYLSADDLLARLQNQATQTQFDFSVSGNPLTVGGATFPAYTAWHMFKDTTGSACFGGVGYSFHTGGLYQVSGGWDGTTSGISLTITQK